MMRSFSDVLEKSSIRFPWTGTLRSPSQILTCLKIALALSISIFLVIALQPMSTASRYSEGYSLIPHYNNAIPSIVHYVHIKKDYSSKLEFSFAHFLSLYAAAIHVRASKVYIHTDYTTAEIAEARLNGSDWTQKVLNTFPELLEWNHVRVPLYSGTNENTKVDHLQHKADFLRWETITPIGGVYMDWDVVALRPLKPLLTAGFAFVAGRQVHNDPYDHDGSKGEINNGIFMTRPNSLMATIMTRDQSANFAGEWSDNLKFTTRVAERLVSIPGEVLICDRNAFSPATWFKDSKEQLFLLHNDSSPEPPQSSSADPMERYQAAISNRRSRREWEWDLSSTYTLHAFGQREYNKWITPKKILARTSNYGVAVWGTVKKMVSDGIITGDEDTS